MKVTMIFVAIAFAAASLVLGAPIPEVEVSDPLKWAPQSPPVQKPPEITTELQKLREQKKVTTALDKLKGDVDKPVPTTHNNNLDKLLDKSKSETPVIKSATPNVVSSPETPKTPTPSKTATEPSGTAQDSKQSKPLQGLFKEDDSTRGLRPELSKTNSESLLKTSETGSAKPIKLSKYQRLKNYFSNSTLGKLGSKMGNWDMSSYLTGKLKQSGVFASDDLLGKMGKLGKSVV